MKGVIEALIGRRSSANKWWLRQLALVWIPGCSSYPVLSAVASPYFTGKDPMQILIAWVQMVQHRPLLCIPSLVGDRVRGQARTTRRGWGKESEGRLNLWRGASPTPPSICSPVVGQGSHLSGLGHFACMWMVR